MIKGLEKLESDWNAMAKTVKEKALMIIEVEAVKSIKKNFQVGGRPKWVPTKKKGKAKGTKTLVIKGTMSNVSASADVGSSRVIITGNPQAREYSKIQNEGGVINMPSRTVKHRKVTSGKNKGRTVFARKDSKRAKETKTKGYKIEIPARPWMVIPPEDAERISKKIFEELKK